MTKVNCSSKARYRIKERISAIIALKAFIYKVMRLVFIVQPVPALLVLFRTAL